MTEAHHGPKLVVRQLGAGAAAPLHWIDAVYEPAAHGRTIRVFLRAGCEFNTAQPPENGLRVLETREVSGARMVVAADESSGKAPLKGLSGVAEIALSPAEPELFTGRNVIMGFRSVETPVVVAEWLAYHALHHGLTGALIVNRANSDTAFAEALSKDLAARHDLAQRDLTVVVLECPIPLGKPGLGPENHPFLAPDAPGKDRMVQPAPDPWLSALGEPLVYELAKWRFLSAARAVLTIDCSDILAHGPQNAFDLCKAAKGGVVLLAGRRIYPWRVRVGRAAGFGDHVCRQFDARRGIARWGVSPAKAGLENTWRAIRVAYARPDPGTIVPFWRAMALKVPDQKPSVLAPKTSLIEEPALLRMAENCFGVKPVRPPKSVARTAPATALSAGRTCIVTTMKNEGPFLLEWLAYHRAIGVEDFLVYTNDCTDGTDTFLDVLNAKGLVAHRNNPYRTMPGLRPQHAALQAAEEEYLVKDAGWIICMDVDEFINIKIGDGTLASLYEAVGDANMVSLTWRLFGNADVADYEDSFVLQQFQLAAEAMARKPHQAWGFKTLFRNIAIYKKLGVHRPKGLKPDLWTEVKWLNGSGVPMPREILRNGWRSSTESYGYDWVQLNHYACRSAESFLVKRDRGRVNHVDRDQGINYWFRMNHNSVAETSVQRMLPLLQKEYERLLADPDIRRAHMVCVAAHQEKIAKLRQKPDFADLYKDLTGERFRGLSRLLRHFGASVFNAGPGVIPHDLHRMTLPDGFFLTVDHDGHAQH